MQLGKIIKCGKKYFINEAYRFGVNSYLGFYNNTTDKKYIKKEGTWHLERWKVPSFFIS